MAAPRSVGPAVFLGSPPTLTLWVPPGVCGGMAAPRSVGPAVFLGSPPTLNTLGPSWSVRRHGRSLQCGTCGFPGLTANPQHTFGPSWSVRLHGRSLQCGTRGLPGLTANPEHSWSLLECTTPWPLLAVWDPRFSWAHRQPTYNGSLQEWAVPCPLLAVWDPRFSWAHRQPTTLLVPPGVCGSWPLLQCGTCGLLGLTANPQHLKRLDIKPALLKSI